MASRGLFPLEQWRDGAISVHMTGEGITVIENTAMAQATAETNWRIERNARLHQTDRKHYVPSFIQKRVELPFSTVPAPRLGAVLRSRLAGRDRQRQFLRPPERYHRHRASSPLHGQRAMQIVHAGPRIPSNTTITSPAARQPLPRGRLPVLPARARHSSATADETAEPANRSARSTRHAKPRTPDAPIAHDARRDPTAVSMPIAKQFPAPAGFRRRIDPDHSAGARHQRATGIAGVQRRVSLDHALQGASRGRAQGASQRAHEVGCYGALEAERIADGRRQ